jgi:acetate kinase
MERLVLALNCGSSSLKFGLYRSDDSGPMLVREGEAEEIGGKNSATPDHAAALKQALAIVSESGDVFAVGHRIVHGGPSVRTHQVLTPQVAEKLHAAIPFAPLHLPAALSVLHATEQALPKARQVVCIDTAFHNEMPDVAKTFALPVAVRRLGVERFGFHGLSLESIMARMDPAPGHLVIAHLGNGASVTAILNGRSIDTSMGLTPSGGVMMGTRSGDIDPGAIVYLMRNGYSDAKKLEALIDHESGLLGISQMTSDVRELLNVRRQNAQADLALEMFCYQVAKTVAGMATALGGIDVLVFTGGIGEHAAPLREEICARLQFLANFEVRVLPSQEDLQIAKIAEELASA